MKHGFWKNQQTLLINVSQASEKRLGVGFPASALADFGFDWL